MAHNILTQGDMEHQERLCGDEDEGSFPQGKANRDVESEVAFLREQAGSLGPGKSKDQRKPSGCPPPDVFPSN